MGLGSPAHPEPSGKAHCRSEGGLNLAKPGATGAMYRIAPACNPHIQHSAQLPKKPSSQPGDTARG